MFGAARSIGRSCPRLDTENQNLITVIPSRALAARILALSLDILVVGPGGEAGTARAPATAEEHRPASRFTLRG